MLLRVLHLAATVAPSFQAVVTSGLYRIASNYFPLDVISQNGNDILLESEIQGRLQQLWSVILESGTATIQNVGTKAFLSVQAGENFNTTVPSREPHNWTFTGDTLSSASIISGGQTLVGDLEGGFPLILINGDGVTAAAVWNLIPALPLPHAYRVWNQATNLYLDQFLGECDILDFCVLASAFNASSKSQVWHVAGTSLCGGRPTLQNAASGDFLASGPDLTPAGTRAELDPSPYPWRYRFVGGQLTIHDMDFVSDITTLTVIQNKAVLSQSSFGPEAAPEQTWVFIPVYD